MPIDKRLYQGWSKPARWSLLRREQPLDRSFSLFSSHDAANIRSLASTRRDSTKTPSGKPGAVQFEGWRYLDEMKLEKAGIVFHGPPAKMILMAQQLEGVVHAGI